MELFVPDNLDVDTILPLDLAGDERDRFHDRIVYFCHTLVNALKSKKTFDKFIDTGYVPLMKLYLRNIMGEHTDSVITVLENEGVIAVDRSFEKGVRARGYVLNDRFRSSHIKKVELRSYQVKKTLRSRDEQFEDEQKRLRAKIPNVIQQLRKNRWRIDTDGAVKWIESFEKALYSAIRSSELIPDAKREDIVTKYQHYYQFIRIQLHLIEGGVWNMVIDEKSGRLHTTVTNLPRPLRYFLTLEGGDHLISLDVKNSQPFLMGYTTQQQFWSTSTDYKDATIKLMGVDREIHRRIMLEDRDERREIIKMLDLTKTLTGTGFDRLNFLSLVRDGRFYEELMSQFRGRFLYKERDRFSTREATKTEMLRIMYFDTRKANVPFYAPFRAFAELFPMEARIMKLLKKNDYKEFPILLQKIESKLILEETGRELQDIPFMTVHDSFIIQARDEDRVREITAQVFEKHLGCAPRLGRSEYTPENAFNELDDYVREKLGKLELKFSSSFALTSEDISLALPEIDK